MMKITGLSHLFKWENLHNWWLTKYFFATLYVVYQNIGALSLTVHFINDDFDACKRHTSLMTTLERICLRV